MGRSIPQIASSHSTMRIESKYKYELEEISDDFMCVPSILLTVIKQHTKTPPTQEEIVNFLGIWLPEEYQLSPLITNRHTTQDKNEYGIRVTSPQINKLFAHLAIPLVESYIPINHLLDWEFEECIEDNIRKSNHVICGYSYQYLFHQTPSPIGHVSLITAINDGEISLLNPDPESSGINKVRASDLYNSIKHKKDGLWIISPAQ